MSEQTTPQPNRTPWIIAGVLGCLVLCLIVAVAGGGIYFMTQNTGTPTRPLVIGQSSSASSAQSSVKPPASVSSASSASSASSVPSSVQPPVASSSAQSSVVSSAASSTSSAASKPAGPSGKIAFSKNLGDRNEDREVWIMNVDGSNAKKILDRASSPAFSPDGAKVAFFRWTDGVFVANSDGTDVKKVVGDTFTRFLEYSHDGRWIAFTAQPGGSGNTVIDLAPPDGTALQNPGARRNVAVGFSPSWSPDDTELLFSTCRVNDCGIFKGKISGGEPVMVVGESTGVPVWSPDGKRVLYQRKDGNAEQVHVMNADGSNRKQLTLGPALHVSANWSVDGNYIFYRSPEAGTWAIYRMNADGTNPVKLIDNVPPVNFAYEKLAVSK